MPPNHHKEIAKFLRDKHPDDAKVIMYRDDNGKRPVAVGEYALGNGIHYYSSIGAIDMELNLPSGNYELAVCGKLKWLPNALVSSIYWLREREIDEWPMYCEDTVKHNARSTYRHIAYIPSSYVLEVSTGQTIRWLLGVPITDRELGLSETEIVERVRFCYPKWLFEEVPDKRIPLNAAEPHH